MNMDIPKQYIEVADRMIITESIRPFMECELVRDIRIVADEMWHGRILDEYEVLGRSYMIHQSKRPIFVSGLFAESCTTISVNDALTLSPDIVEKMPVFIMVKVR